MVRGSDYRDKSMLLVVLCLSATFLSPAAPRLVRRPHLSSTRSNCGEIAMARASKKPKGGGGGFTSTASAGGAQTELLALRAELADAMRLIDELKAENSMLQLTSSAPAASAGWRDQQVQKPLDAPAESAARARREIWQSDAPAEPAVPVPRKKIRALRKVSSMPLVFMIDEFVDKETCARLKGGGGSAMWQVLEQDNGPPDAGNQAQLEFATLVAGELFAGQWGPNDGIRFNSASSSDPNNDGSLRVTYPDGLHVDTNNGAIFRCVTCILYLNDLPAECGGATIFPLARAAKAVPQGAHVSTAEAMLREQCTHTRSPVTPTVTGIRVEGGVPKALETQVAQLEELGEPVDESVVRVQPEAGSLCIFFSRLDDGHVRQLISIHRPPRRPIPAALLACSPRGRWIDTVLRRSTRDPSTAASASARPGQLAREAMAWRVTTATTTTRPRRIL